MMISIMPDNMLSVNGSMVQFNGFNGFNSVRAA